MKLNGIKHGANHKGRMASIEALQSLTKSNRTLSPCSWVEISNKSTLHFILYTVHTVYKVKSHLQHLRGTSCPLLKSCVTADWLYNQSLSLNRITEANNSEESSSGLLNTAPPASSLYMLNSIHVIRLTVNVSVSRSRAESWSFTHLSVNKWS